MSLEEQHDPKSEFKRKRSESPVSTSMTCDYTELSEGPNEYRNKRVKTERPASPAPSFLSLKSDLSMTRPINLKEEEVFPLQCREKFERPSSPTASYLSLKTAWSKDAPDNFRKREDFHVDTRIWTERATSPTLSSVSELTQWFDEPTNFKAEPTLHLNPRLLTENHLKCPVCKSILKDPVSIPCGHNFCRDCISSLWHSCAEDYVCPRCGGMSKIRPELNTNTALAEVVKSIQQAGFSPALPPCSYAGPGDVACDICPDKRLKAVKSCLTCNAFLCETHIKEHYTVPALQKHKLSDVTGAEEENLSMLNLPEDFSSICGEQENERSISELGLNVSMPIEAAGISTPETAVQKYPNAINLEFMYSKLQSEVLGLKKSFSTFKKRSTRETWDEESDGVEGSDDEERDEEYSDSEEEENENSYDGEEDNYDDMDYEWSDMDKSDNDNDNDEDISDNDEYDEENYENGEDEYDEDEYDKDDYDEDKYDEDEYEEDKYDEDEYSDDDYNS